MSTAIERIIATLGIPLSPEQLAVQSVRRRESLMWYLKQAFLDLDQEKPLVVWDADDILHPLIHVIADDLGIDVARATYTFSVRDNSKLTKEEQDEIIAAFHNVKYFQSISFAIGVERLLVPQQFGADTQINSNSFSEKIGDLKREQLLAAIPGLKPEQIKINVIHYGETHRKEFDPRTTILHDDSPFNIALSPALINTMPSWMQWSRDVVAKAKIASKPVLYLESLNQMIDFSSDAVRAMVT